ncbi:MAG: TylF/MycF/NovP-related O-methyltransferase [Bacteroidota bacterium]
MDLAPIILFVYNRPWHTEQTLEALMENELADQSTLYIYSDGPKKNASKEDLKKIKEVRAVIREKKWCSEVNIIESKNNKGLADSIVEGVTHLVKKYGKIIVLEDDLLLSKGFLRYMNDALNLYENEEKVMHISGYMFPIKEKLPETFFYNAATCWGWATWERAWESFNPNASELYLKLLNTNNLDKFDYKGNFGFLKQLIDNKNGKLKTWAIKWHTSLFLKNGLCLHPNHSLVNNIGHDGTGDNCGKSEKFKWSVLAKNINVTQIKLNEATEAYKAMVKYNAPNAISKKIGLKKRIIQFIPNFIKLKLKNALKINKYKKLYVKYKEFTMIPEAVFVENLELVERFRDIKGCVIECGVWRGGMAAAIAEIFGENRKYYLFDSFEGLPEVKEIDGKAANDWQNNKESKFYFDNCTAEIKYAEKSMKLSLVPNYEIIKGWFSETLPEIKINEEIALLRLDGDWYESTMDCLVHLYPHVIIGGVIIIDDYYMWDGCAKAVHDYFSKNNISARIRQSKLGVCYIIKN